MIKLIELGWGSETPAFRQVFTTLFMPEASLEQIRAFDALQRISCSAQTAARIVAGFGQIDVRALAKDVRCPTLVLHSNDDARIPFELGRELASLIPGAHFSPFDCRNHVLVNTEPAWGEFMEQVREFTRDVMLQSQASASALPASMPTLTARENELAGWVAQGLDNHQIAAQLGLSEKTVRSRLRGLLNKLGVESRALELMQEARRGRR